MLPTSESFSLADPLMVASLTEVFSRSMLPPTINFPILPLSALRLPLTIHSSTSMEVAVIEPSARHLIAFKELLTLIGPWTSKLLVSTSPAVRKLPICRLLTLTALALSPLFT